MIFLVAAFFYGGAGLVLGSLIGFLIGTILRWVDSGKSLPPSGHSGCGSVAVCSGVGALIGGVVGMYLCYSAFFGDGPSYGYPDRATYRAAEMQARATELDPTVIALGKFQAEWGAYPTQLHELVTRKYLAALPTANPLDHLGSPQRVNGSLTYHHSPNADQYALRFTCQFTEDKRGMGFHSESWVYDSRNPGWQPGSPPPDWPGKKPEPPPAAKEGKDKK